MAYQHVVSTRALDDAEYVAAGDGCYQHHRSDAVDPYSCQHLHLVADVTSDFDRCPAFQAAAVAAVNSALEVEHSVVDQAVVHPFPAGNLCGIPEAVEFPRSFPVPASFARVVDAAAGVQHAYEVEAVHESQRLLMSAKPVLVQRELLVREHSTSAVVACEYPSLVACPCVELPGSTVEAVR